MFLCRHRLLRQTNSQKRRRFSRYFSSNPWVTVERRPSGPLTMQSKLCSHNNTFLGWCRRSCVLPTFVAGGGAQTSARRRPNPGPLRLFTLRSHSSARPSWMVSECKQVVVVCISGGWRSARLHAIGFSLESGGRRAWVT